MYSLARPRYIYWHLYWYVLIPIVQALVFVAIFASQTWLNCNCWQWIAINDNIKVRTDRYCQKTSVTGSRPHFHLSMQQPKNKYMPVLKIYAHMRTLISKSTVQYIINFTFQLMRAQRLFNQICTRNVCFLVDFVTYFNLLFNNDFHRKTLSSIIIISATSRIAESEHP